jgi:spore coat polysaccharide biosynthesis predicted glycosyltransferase SpsG
MEKDKRTDPVAIRVDGSLSQGMGHIVRMISVARGLSEKGIPCIFIMKPFKEGYSVVEQAGFPIYLINSDNEAYGPCPNLLKKIVMETGTKLVIHDIRATTYEYMAELKRLGVFAVNFDDTGRGGALADILVDAFVPEEKGEEDLQHYFGPKYLILRDRFAEHKKSGIQKNVKKICLMPGGTNAGSIMEKLITWIQELPDAYEIYVMAGASTDNEPALYSSRKNSVYMIRDWDSGPEILAQSDISITSGGISMCESCASGIPTMSVAQVEHEISNILFFSKYNAVHPLGAAHNLSKEVFLRSFLKLKKSYSLRKALSLSGMKLVDSQGKQRVIRIVQGFYNDIGSMQNVLMKTAVN